MKSASVGETGASRSRDRRFFATAYAVVPAALHEFSRTANRSLGKAKGGRSSVRRGGNRLIHVGAHRQAGPVLLPSCAAFVQRGSHRPTPLERRDGTHIALDRIVNSCFRKRLQTGGRTPSPPPTVSTVVAPPAVNSADVAPTSRGDAESAARVMQSVNRLALIDRACGKRTCWLKVDKDEGRWRSRSEVITRRQRLRLCIVYAELSRPARNGRWRVAWAMYGGAGCRRTIPGSRIGIATALSMNGSWMVGGPSLDVLPSVGSGGPHRAGRTGQPDERRNARWPKGSNHRALSNAGVGLGRLQTDADRARLSMDRSGAGDERGGRCRRAEEHVATAGTGAGSSCAMRTRSRRRS